MPKGWIIDSISNTFELIRDKGLIGGSPYLEIGNININNKKYTFTDKKSVKGCKKAIKGDVLISRVRPTRGAITQVKEKNLEVSSAFTILRNTYGFNEKYLWYYLAWNNEYLNYLGSNCTGTMYPTVSESIAVNYQVPIAPLNEQRRIVAKLERLLHKVDACKERLEKIPAILKRFRQSVLAAACSGRLTADWREHNPDSVPSSSLIQKERIKIAEPDGELSELPDKWTWVALGNYGNCSRGRFSVRPRNDPRYFGGKHPFIQIGNLPSEGGWIRSHTQTLNEKGLAVSKQFPKGTTVIAIVGATIGNTGLLAYDMCFTDSMVGIETGTEEGNRYVEFFLRHKKFEIRQASYSSGGQPNIKLEFLNPYPLALPPLPEQQEIVRRVEALFKKADEIKTRYQKAKVFVDRLTQSILAKAFLGELVPQHPNDVPASVLLERIRDANAINLQKKRKKSKLEKEKR